MILIVLMLALADDIDDGDGADDGDVVHACLFACLSVFSSDVGGCGCVLGAGQARERNHNSCTDPTTHIGRTRTTLHTCDTPAAPGKASAMHSLTMTNNSLSACNRSTRREKCASE